jgi:hypothetical protein
MRRVSLEAWLLFISAATLLPVLSLILLVIYDREPPKFTQVPLFFAALAGPFIALGVIAVTLLLRLRGKLKLKNPYVFTSVVFACLNLFITSGVALLIYIMGQALGNGLIFG